MTATHPPLDPVEALLRDRDGLTARQHADRWDAMSPEDVKRYRGVLREQYLRGEGSFLRATRLLAGLFDVATDLADRIATDHPPDCGCRGCAENDRHGHARHDFRGFVWTLSQCHSVAMSTVVYEFEQDPERSFGDELRALAELCDEYESTIDPEPPESKGGDEADVEPVLVEGGAR